MNEAHNRKATESQNGDKQLGTVQLPAPTPWPFLMALGLTLAGVSLLTTIWLIWLGALLFVISALGWFHNVLPHEAHEDVPVTEELFSFVPVYENVARIEVGETHRAQLPLETFPVSSGIMGGIAGGLAMVIPAEIYGVVRHHSIWYVVNLLGRRRRGVVDPSHRRADEPFSSERIHHRQYHPGRDHSPRRHPLRRAASYLASKTNPARRHRCANCMDRLAVQHSRAYQSVLRKTR